MATPNPNNAQSERSLVTGYMAAKQSKLVWSLPVQCKLFLLTDLDPDLWYELRAGESSQNPDISQFGIAIGRSLKSVADKDWDKGHPAQIRIDSIGGGRNANKSTGQLETLVLVKAMDIASGFLSLPCRSYYPSFSKKLSFDARQLGFLKRLDGWTQKLDEISTSLRIYNGKKNAPLLPLRPTTTEDNEILHTDICLLANHWKHESAKNWLKVLCVLDGVAFHIRLLRYHNGVEQTSLWQRFIKDNYDHPDVKMIMGDDETIKRFKKNLPRWKQAFANAVAISPLVLIMGQGMGQTLNTPLALQVGGRLSSMGKPKLIRHIEEILWKYIVGIAWGSWTSEVGLSKFLADVLPLVRKMQAFKAAAMDGTDKGWVGYEAEDTWFEDSITFIQQNRVPGLEAKIATETRQWLKEGRSRWIKAKKGGHKSERVERSSSCPPRVERGIARPSRREAKPRRRSPSLSPSRCSSSKPAFTRDAISKICRLLTYRVNAWGHKHYPKSTEQPEWQHAPTMPPLTVRDIEQISERRIVIGTVPPICEESSQTVFPLSQEQKKIHERKLSQDVDASWRQLMLMASSLRMAEVQDDLPSISGKKRQRSNAVDMAADRTSKKAKLDRGLSRSPNPITSPLVWAPAKKQYRTFDYYPLISNEIDDRHALDGWNACIATDASGDPLYRLKATGKGTKESMIVTLKQSIALRYPGATVETFRRNNILLFDTKTLPLTWSLDSLRAIGNVDLVREVQDHQRRSSEETKEYIHVNVSLREMYEEGLLEEGRILNALSLPRNTSHSDHPLQSIISSDIRAFEQTSNLPTDVYTSGYPVSATSFWLVATKGAISYIHPDCFGVGTVVEVLCGRKLWYVFQRRRTVGNRQDSYIDEYMGDWAPGFIPDPKDWTAEVVLLEPGSAFYMRPDTHHAVVTLENSIVKGHHFYSTATLSKTVSGWVHTCMLGYSITNVLHTELLEVLLRMMCYFGATISGEGPERHDTDIPSVEREGLLDLIALGNLCLFAPALYTCICDERESLRPAIAMAAGAYISIIQRLRTRYCLIFFEEDAKVAAHAPESMMCVDGVSLRVASLDIANFARTSAAHFGRSLIFYAHRALRQEKASGQHESLWIDFKQFRQDIEDSMHTYLQMELTSEFVDAYKRREAKRLFLRPVFLVLQKSEVLQTEAMTDWTNILDFDPSDNEEDDDSYSEDSDGGKSADRESGDRDSDNEQDFTTTNLLEEDAMDGAEEDANSQIGSELTSEGRNSRDQSYCP